MAVANEWTQANHDNQALDSAGAMMTMVMINSVYSQSGLNPMKRYFKSQVAFGRPTPFVLLTLSRSAVLLLAGPTVIVGRSILGCACRQPL